MLVINSGLLDAAAEAVMIAAVDVRDEQGLVVATQLPTCKAEPGEPIPGPKPDYRRIRAIVLGAIVALTGETCRISDEIHLVGFNV